MTDFRRYVGRPLEFFDDFGITLLDWQRSVVSDLLAVGDDGRMLYDQAAVSVHRQAGKSVLLAAIGVYRFVTYPGDVLTAAQGVDGARRTIRYARAMFQKNRSLSSAVKPQRERFLLLGTPYEWEVTSSDSLFARGRAPRCVLGDEAGWWEPKNEMLDTLTPSLGAQDQGLLILASTRGRKDSPLETLLELGQVPNSRVYRFYSSDLVSPLIKPDYVAREKARMNPLIFDREWKNLLHDSEVEYATQAELRAAFGDHGRSEQEALRYVFVDLATSGVASGAVASRRTDGTVFIEELEVWQGSRTSPIRLSTVEEWIQGMCRRHVVELVQIESWQGQRSVEVLENLGLPVQAVSQTAGHKSSQLGNLQRLFQEHTIALPRNKQLRDELEGATAEPSATGLKVTGVIHLDLVISVSGAALLATEEASDPDADLAGLSFPGMAH